MYLPSDEIQIVSRQSMTYFFSLPSRTGSETGIIVPLSVGGTWIPLIVENIRHVPFQEAYPIIFCFVDIGQNIHLVGLHPLQRGPARLHFSEPERAAVTVREGCDPTYFRIGT